MKAVVYAGPRDLRVEDVPDPKLPADTGAVVRVTSTGICGSDLHIYNGHGFSDDLGYSVGHEAVGEVVEVGPRVTRFAVGDRVLVPGSTACEGCPACHQGLVARCHRQRLPLEACYGLSHLLPGCQAEYVAVPAADLSLVALPVELSDAAGVMLTDNLPTAWYGARRARINPGDSVVVIGLGPVGIGSVQSALALGAGTVFGVDLLPDRLERAAALGAVPVASAEAKSTIRKALDGPPAIVLEAVGADSTIALGLSLAGPGTRISIVGVSQNRAFPVDMTLAQMKELEIAIGLCSVQYELPALLRLAMAGRLDPAAAVTHRIPLSEAAAAYEMFAERHPGVGKVILDPMA